MSRLKSALMKQYSANDATVPGRDQPRVLAIGSVEQERSRFDLQEHVEYHINMNSTI